MTTDDNIDRRSGKRLRRSFLKGTGLAATGFVAGCLGGGGGGSGGGSGGSSGGGGGTPSAGMDTFQNEAGVEVGADFDAVRELAGQESGTVNYYATLDREDVGPLLEAFQSEFSEISVEHTTGTSSDLASRWFSEYNSNNVVGDVFTEGDRSSLIWSRGQAMELSADWLPSYGEADEQFRGEHWLPLRLVLGSFFYNTNSVESDAVTAWTDPVTDSRWQNNLGWDPTPDLMLMSWFHDNYGREFFENLKNQSPQWTDSHTDLARFAGAGEFPISFTYTHKYAEFANELPVDYFELDPHPAAVNPIVINNKSPVPNSSIVFVNWLTSKEGQTVFGEGDYIPFHPDAPFKGAPGVYPNPNYEVETIVPTTERIETISSVWEDVMSEILPG